MKIFNIYLILLSVIFSVYGYTQGKPKIGDVKIENVKIKGSGCPKGTPSVIITNSKPNGPADYFQVTFDDFIVSKPGVSSKFCNIELDVKYPGKWTYSIFGTEADGYGEIYKGHSSVYSLEFSWKNSGQKPKKIKEINNKPWSGDYSKKINFGEKINAPCGKVLPVKLKATIGIEGTTNTNETSILSVDRQSGIFTQKWRINWEKC